MLIFLINIQHQEGLPLFDKKETEAGFRHMVPA